MRRLWPALIAPILLAACGSEEHTDIKQWMKEATKDVRGRVPPLPEIKPFPVVSYDASDLIDPFQPSKIQAEKKTSGGGVRPDFDRRKEELEKYALGTLRFVGLLRNDKMLNALIVADNRIYRVKIGNHLGQDYGMVTDIQVAPGLGEGSKLILKELVQDPSGEWVERDAALEMHALEAKK